MELRGRGRLGRSKRDGGEWNDCREEKSAKRGSK